MAGSIEFPPGGAANRVAASLAQRAATRSVSRKYKPNSFFGIEVLPPAAALKLTNMGKPPLRERVPFLGNLIEADSALRNRHWVPPGTRESRQPNDANASMTTESCTKTTAYRVRSPFTTIRSDCKGAAGN